jgi:hypothetical protein
MMDRRNPALSTDGYFASAFATHCGANEWRYRHIVTIFMCASAPFIKEDDLESVRGLLEELFPLLSKADAQWSRYRGTPRSSERGRVQCVAY